MIFHSANNLKKEKKEKKKRKKRKKKKKRKEGIKEFQYNPHAIIVTCSIPFKHGQVIFKFDVDRVVNEFG